MAVSIRGDTMKTKLDGERITALTQYVRSGTYNAVAAENAGIGERTLYRWLTRGEAETKGIYWQLWQAIKKARADAETERVGKIREYGMGTRTTHKWTVRRANGDVEEHEDYGTGNWQALAWLLERQYPERWGRREKVEVTGKEGEQLPPPVIQFIMPDGVVERPERNGGNGNGSSTVTHTVGKQSAN